jgi:hypothetical protein
MDTVLLLGRSDTGKTICIVNKIQADHYVDPDMSQSFVTHSSRICSVVPSLQGFTIGVQVEDSESFNLHFLTLYEVVHHADRSLGFADKKIGSKRRAC